MPVPGEPENVRRGKSVVADAIRSTFPGELFPENEWAFRYHLDPHNSGGSGVDVLYKPNPGYSPGARIRRPVKVYVRDFPQVEVLVCDEEFLEQADALIGDLNSREGVSARKIDRIPYWCNWGAGDRKPEPFLG